MAGNLVRSAEDRARSAKLAELREAEVLDWSRARWAELGFKVLGVFRAARRPRLTVQRHRPPEDLEAKLLAGGRLQPLPKEPAALPKGLAVAIVDHLLDATGSRSISSPRDRLSPRLPCRTRYRGVSASDTPARGPR